jgi:hypothetical protein
MTNFGVARCACVIPAGCHSPVLRWHRFGPAPSCSAMLRMRHVVQKRRIAVCTEAKALRVRAGHGQPARFVSSVNDFLRGRSPPPPAPPGSG